jgi:hypothetical protein
MSVVLDHVGAAPAGTVDHHSNLSSERFAADYLYRQRPVVLQGALKHWRAIGKWSPRFFAERYPDREVPVDPPCRMTEFIDLVERSDEDHPAPYLHAAHKFRDLFPDLVDDLTPLPECVAPNWLRRWLPTNLGRRLLRDSQSEIFIGGKGAAFPWLHWDELHYLVFICQIYGDKQFILYPPEQSPLLYPQLNRRTHSQIRDLEQPDLERFPRFAEARPLTCTVSAGDVLFMPGGWWHTTRMPTASISLAINGANASNWRAMVADLREELKLTRPALAGIAAAGLRVFGWGFALGDRLFRRPRASELLP